MTDAWLVARKGDIWIPEGVLREHLSAAIRAYNEAGPSPEGACLEVHIRLPAAKVDNRAKAEAERKLREIGEGLLASGWQIHISSEA